MTVYADTSFLASLYLPDEHTSEAERRLSISRDIWLTPLHIAELLHAIQQSVFHKGISRKDADRVLRKFRDHRAERLWHEVASPERCFDVCSELAQQYAASIGVRTLDTLHVASALELHSANFWTFDQRQRKLARLAGFKD